MLLFVEADSGMSSLMKDATGALTDFFGADFFAGATFFTVGFVTVFVTGAAVDFFGAVVVFFAGDFFGAVVLERDDVFFVAVFFLASAIRNEDIK